jgi:O-antigen/teichoic acid export membrane protein
MPLLNKVRANVLWSMGGQVGYAGFSWLATVMLARADPHGGVVGQFALASAMLFPIVVFCNLQLRTVIVSDATQEFAFADYFGFRVVSVLATVVGVSAIALFRGPDPVVARLLGALTCVKISDGLADGFHAYLQRHGRLDRMAVSLLLRGLSNVVGIVIGFRLFHALSPAILFMAAILSLEIVLYEIGAVRRTRAALSGSAAWQRLVPRFSPRTLVAIGRRAIPLGLAALIGAFALQLPVYLIDHRLGREAQGRFSVLYGPLMATPIFVVAALEGVLAQLSAAAAARDVHLWRHLLGRLVGLAAALAVAMVVGAVLLGKPVITLVYGPSYAENTAVLVWLTIGIGLGFITTVLSAAVIANRQFKTMLVVSLAQLPVALTLIFCGVYFFGEVGVGYAMVIGQALSIAVFWLLARAWVRQSQMPIA